jgi:hypothetical protein
MAVAEKDTAVEFALNNLKEKNTYVQGERKKYQINFYSKYSVLARESTTFT